VKRLRRRLAIVAVLAAMALPSALVTAEGGPLEPFRRVFKAPADTLKGLVVPKDKAARATCRSGQPHGGARRRGQIHRDA
jgi:hypothetical protein